MVSSDLRLTMGACQTPQFGLPLHEYRVRMKDNELIVGNIDEGHKTGMLVWERVPTSHRPLHRDRNYVDNVLNHEPIMLEPTTRSNNLVCRQRFYELKTMNKEQ
jgi:hypothetical protein